MNTSLKYVLVGAFIIGFFAPVQGKELGKGKMAAVSLGITLEPSLLVTAWDAKEDAVKVLDQVAQFNKALGLVTDNKIEGAESVEVLPAAASEKIATNKDVAAFVQRNRDQLVTPIDSFLAPFRNMGIIIIPLLKESLGENSMLERLFKTDSKISVKAFFEKEVKTIDTLTVMGNEFVTFFNDLEESLFIPAKKKYHEALKKHKDGLKTAKSLKKP